MSVLALISPAKTLDYDSPLITQEHTVPQFLSRSAELIKICKKLDAPALSNLMKISDTLAALNVARFAEWEKAVDFDSARQAVFAFKGDVYQGLEAETLNEENIQFMQQHLRILSGLYGILRPLDLMRPYRLEMGTKLANPKGKNLYEFWDAELTNHLNQLVQTEGHQALINLASDEYFGAIMPNKLKVPIIKPVFLDEKNGTYKIISFYAKKARGLMTRYIINNQIQDTEALKQFDYEEYQFDEEATHVATQKALASKKPSYQTEWIFKRSERSLA